MEPRIIEDGPEVAVRKLSYEGACFLNRQTAGNAELVAGARECGCFHCGHRFAPAEVTSWIEGDEPYGGRTALCPCCGADAVIVGTEEPPLVLSTALLASLYLWWFKAEYEERLERATYAPSWYTRDDYLRHGVPFRLRDDARVERLGSIGLFPIYFSTPWEDPNAAKGAEALDKGLPWDGSWGLKPIWKPGDKLRFGSAGDWGGVISEIRVYLDEYGYYLYTDFIDAGGGHLAYEPWGAHECELVKNLAARYGSRLRGIIKKPLGDMELYVETADGAPR